MTMTDIQNLAPNVAIVAIFIWYLVKKDKLMEEMFGKLSNKLEQLGHVISSLESRLASIEHARKANKE
jgi:hypothetical protein